MCKIKSTGQKTVDIHIRGRAQPTRERQAKLASAKQQLDPHYVALATVLSSTESTK